MFAQFRQARQDYPNQYWLMFWGMLVSTIGSSMIWPFLMIYVSERLTLPLAAVSSLMTLNAVMSFISSFVAGALADRFGRKWVMVISLAVNGLGYLLLSMANTLPIFAFVMGMNGFFNPLYRVGADAMMADLIPPEKRPEAYSIMRMSNNLGVALGPAIGGFIASASYTIAFYIAAIGMSIYGLLMAVFAHETLQSGPAIGQFNKGGTVEREYLGGYNRILKDKPFLLFNLVWSLNQICAAMVWVLLSVYAKQNYNVPESLYGFIPTTNAIMVVLFQVAVTQVTRRYKSLSVLALGSVFYAAAVGSVAFGYGFWGFWISMVILTVGELMLVPTSTTYVANLAPADMRGRYMSVYGLTWVFAMGVGPLLGGVLNDQFGPKAIWYGGAFIGFLSVIGFIVLAKRFQFSREERTNG
jgi:MFS family permease